jgi:hypothetical protein
MKHVKKSLIIPVLASVLILLLTYVAPIYYASYLYTGTSSSEPILSYNDDINFLAVFFFLGIGIFLKYFVYDLIGRRITNNNSIATLKAIFWIFYLLALGIDFYSVFVSSKPISDAGFAALAIFMYTPPILILSLIVVAVSKLFTKLPKAR